MTGAPDRRPGPALRMRATAAALAGLGLLLAGPAGPQVARAHGTLLSSDPGAGEVLGASPAEVRLVFGGPLERRFSGVAVIAAGDRVVATMPGEPGSTAADVLVVRPVEPLAPGVYRVDWWALSAADGHATSGSFVFGVAVDAATVSAVERTGPAAPDEAHDHLVATASQARTAAYGGVLVAFGLAVLAFVVIRPGLGAIPRGLVDGLAVALVVAAAGTAVLALATFDQLPDVGRGDPAGYLLGSRSGGLLLGRMLLGLAGSAAVGLLPAGREPVAVAIGGAAAGASLVLAAFGGHAAAYASPVPLVVDAVHLGAAGVWLGGVAGLAGLALFGVGAPTLERVRTLVPRFSGPAFVAAVLLAATGAHQAWLQVGELPLGATGYERTLQLKILVVALAFAVGAVNHLVSDRGTERLGWLGPVDRRLGLEAGLAVVVLVATAYLTSTPPPDATRTVRIAPAGPAAEGTTLALRPGRPGPNRIVLTPAAGPPAATRWEVLLAGPADGAATARLALRPDPEAASDRTRAGRVALVADVGSLAAAGSWTAEVRLVRPDGTAAVAGTFRFALDERGVSEGRATPPVAPQVVIGLGLLLAALLAGGWLARGGSLSGVHAGTGRLAIAAGGIVGALTGLAILLGGPTG